MKVVCKGADPWLLHKGMSGSVVTIDGSPVATLTDFCIYGHYPPEEGRAELLPGIEFVE